MLGSCARLLEFAGFAGLDYRDALRTFRPSGTQLGEKIVHIVKNIGRALLATVALLATGPTLAAMAPPTTSVPTLGEGALAGIAALLAVAAGRALRKR